MAKFIEFTLSSSKKLISLELDSITMVHEKYINATLISLGPGNVTVEVSEDYQTVMNRICAAAPPTPTRPMYIE